LICRTRSAARDELEVAIDEPRDGAIRLALLRQEMPGGVEGNDAAPVRVGAPRFFRLRANALLAQPTRRPQAREYREALNRAVERDVHRGREQPHGFHLRALALVLVCLPMEIQQRRSE